MKLADTNIWLALTLSQHRFHQAAQAWLAGQTPSDPVCFCRATQQSLLRLITTEAVMQRYGSPPLSNADAWTLYEGLLADSRITFCAEPADLQGHWQRLAARETSSPKLWMDAYLAAFAIAGGFQLVTTDKAFQQHPGLDVLVLT